MLHKTKEEKSTLTLEELISLAYPNALTGDFNAAIALCKQFNVTSGAEKRCAIVCSILSIYENISSLPSAFIFHSGTALAHIGKKISDSFDNLAVQSPDVFDALIEESSYMLIDTLEQLSKFALDTVTRRNSVIVQRLCIAIEHGNSPDYACLLLKKIYLGQEESLSPALIFHYGSLFALVDVDISTKFNQLSLSSSSEFDQLIRKELPQRMERILLSLDRSERGTVIKRNKNYFKTLRQEIIAAAGTPFELGIPELIIGYMENSFTFFSQSPIPLCINRPFVHLLKIMRNYLDFFWDPSSREELINRDRFMIMIDDLKTKHALSPGHFLSELAVALVNRKKELLAFPSTSKLISLCDHLLNKISSIDPSLVPDVDSFTKPLQRA